MYMCTFNKEFRHYKLTGVTSHVAKLISRWQHTESKETGA